MSYFVRLNNPKQSRISILTTSKDIIGALKTYYALKGKREEKLKAIREFENDLKEIILLMDKLAEKLPEKDLESMQKYLPKEKRLVTPVVNKAVGPKPKTVVKPKVAPKPHELSEVERLDQALSRIEQKLHSLE